ncbi:MAG: hypothetical protein ACXVHB_29855 [Solirubrobacteraceae bacterium]
MKPFDGRELRLVVLHVDVDVLQLADLFSVAIDQHFAVPLRDVPTGIFLLFGHRRPPGSPYLSW